MLFLTLLVAALVNTTLAGVVIITATTVLTSVSDAAQASKLETKLVAAISSYEASVTKDPKYTSYRSALSEYVATRTDAPASLILDTETVKTLTTIPAWYSAMPSDIKNYEESINAGILKVEESVIKGAAAKPTGAVGMVGAGLAAAAAGAAMIL